MDLPINIQPYEDLLTSTRTVMVYSNIQFNLKRIFRSIQITHVPLKFTKKKSNVDKSKIIAPYGSIISLRYSGMIRGPDLRKKTNRWCILCKPMITKANGDEEKKKTCVQYIHGEPDEYGCREIWMDCSNCGKKYGPSVYRNVANFLHQVTMVMALKHNTLMNIMLFKTNLKIAGSCTGTDDAETVMILWEDYIREDRKLWKFFIPKEIEDSKEESIKIKHTSAQFEFYPVMINVHFNVGFSLCRENLNTLMNDEKYMKVVHMSQFESTNISSTKIRMFHDKNLKPLFDVLVYPHAKKLLRMGEGGSDEQFAPYFEVSDTLHYQTKKKSKKQSYITFIAFASAEVILSGRNLATMKSRYEFFIEELYKNKSFLEEKVRGKVKKLE